MWRHHGPQGEEIDLKMQTGKGGSLEGTGEKGIKVSRGFSLA